MPARCTAHRPAAHSLLRRLAGNEQLLQPASAAHIICHLRETKISLALCHLCWRIQQPTTWDRGGLATASAALTGTAELRPPGGQQRRREGLLPHGRRDWEGKPPWQHAKLMRQASSAFLIVAVSLFFNAVYAAHKLLSPRDVFGLHNKKISRLEFLRSWAGLITVVGATLRFRGPSRVIGDLIFHVVEALAPGIISLFVCIIVAVMIASPRIQLIARSRASLLKIALTFVPLLVGDALGHVPMVPWSSRPLSPIA